jgi:tetratricopeptide (TPR) repeat protein
MNESSSTVIMFLKIFTEFLSSNSIAIIFLVLLLICKDAISSLISRLTSVSYKNGNSELGIEAAAPKEDKEKIDLHTAEEKPPSEDKDAEIENKEEAWFPEMHKALTDGRLDDAEAAFKKYALDEKDEIKLEENRALYLFLRFEQGKDNSAICELEKLARSAKTENSKFNTLDWLSFCLRDGMQYHKEAEMWRSALIETKSEPLKTRATVNLAHSLNKEDSSIEARKILVDRLISIEDGAQKGTIFEALSRVEYSLGNKSLSIYCKDKALQFDPNNRDELFNSAYSASSEDIDEISISNYLKLIRIDGDNSTALNNLGVRAQEAGLKIKAIDQYKKSAEHNNTLAMANQGYLLLSAGFTDEAEKIAKEALTKDDPHQNIHRLLAEINEKRETQDRDWEELGKKALNRQKMIREYTEQFYLGTAQELKGNWKVDGMHSTTIEIDNDLLKASWAEDVGALGGGGYKVELVGKVSGSTFDGTYSSMRNESAPSTLLGLSGNANKACIGYFSEREGKIKVISKNLKDDFSLFLTPKKA